MTALFDKLNFDFQDYFIIKTTLISLSYSNDMITKTTHKLPFLEIDSLRFEDLGFNIVSRLDNLYKIKHYGRMGSDDGIDIWADFGNEGESKIWFIQCKRYKRFSKKDSKKVIDRIVKSKELPQKILLIIACGCSKSTDNYLIEYAGEHGIRQVEIWTASNLESILYSKYTDLLSIYFGVKIEDKIEIASEITKIAFEMQRRIENELVDYEYPKRNKINLMHQPEKKFISSRLCIHSVEYRTNQNSIELPNGIDSIFRVHFYDLYEGGLEVWLNASRGIKIIRDSNWNWQPVQFNNPNLKNPIFTVYDAIEIGRIPFENIVDFVAIDHVYSEPRLYCKFNIDGEPYEDVYFKIDIGEDGRWDMDKEKLVSFPL